MSRTPEAKRIRLPLPVIKAVDAVYAAIPSANCQRKCQACCSPIGNLCTSFERDRITARAGKAPNEFTPRSGELCNMLSPEGNCTVYDVRPAICRLYGVTKGLRCDFGCTPATGVSDESAAMILMAIRQFTKAYEGDDT